MAESDGFRFSWEDYARVSGLSVNVVKYRGQRSGRKYNPRDLGSVFQMVMEERLGTAEVLGGWLRDGFEEWVMALGGEFSGRHELLKGAWLRVVFERMAERLLGKVRLADIDVLVPDEMDVDDGVHVEYEHGVDELPDLHGATEVDEEGNEIPPGEVRLELFDE